MDISLFELSICRSGQPLPFARQWQNDVPRHIVEAAGLERPTSGFLRYIELLFFGARIQGESNGRRFHLKTEHEGAYANSKVRGFESPRCMSGLGCLIHQS